MTHSLRLANDFCQVVVIVDAGDINIPDGWSERGSSLGIGPILGAVDIGSTKYNIGHFYPR